MRTLTLKDREIHALTALLGDESVRMHSDGACVEALPATTAEVSALMRFAVTYRLPVRVHSKNAPKGGRGLYLCMERFDRLEAVDSQSLLVEAGAAVTGSSLAAELSARGFRPCLNMEPEDTVGAFLSRAPVTPSAYRAGRSEPCCALRAVLADGTEVRTRITPRSAAGPDVKHLLLGTRGAIGVIVSAVLRVEPVDNAVAELAWRFEGRDATVKAADEMYLQGVLWPGSAVLVQEEDGFVLAVGLRGAREAVTAAAAKAAEIAVVQGGEPLGADESTSFRLRDDGPSMGTVFMNLVKKVKGRLDPVGLLNPGEI